MAVKYTRDGAANYGHGEHGRFAKPLRKSTGQLQSRLRLIYYGIGAFTLMMFIAYAMGYLKPREWGPTEHGTGRIAEKSTVAGEDGETLYTVEIALDHADADLSEVVAIDEPAWTALAVGDEVAIEYRISLDGERLRVVLIDAPSM